MMLWIEMNMMFERLCVMEPLPLDLLRRIWNYAQWCMNHASDDVHAAAVSGFCEHLMDTPEKIALLPQLMERRDFLALRGLLEYHNDPKAVDACLRSLWKS